MFFGIKQLWALPEVHNQLQCFPRVRLQVVLCTRLADVRSPTCRRTCLHQWWAQWGLCHLQTLAVWHTDNLRTINSIFMPKKNNLSVNTYCFYTVLLRILNTELSLLKELFHCVELLILQSWASLQKQEGSLPWTSHWHNVTMHIYILYTFCYNSTSHLMLDLDVFVQHAAQFVVISIPLKRLFPSLLKEPLPVLRGAELLGSSR